ncbi:hypothetical protein RSAG8_09915, partial [Rhizoctonia solani AG-8 WAC10335]
MRPCDDIKYLLMILKNKTY